MILRGMFLVAGALVCLFRSSGKVRSGGADLASYM